MRLFHFSEDPNIREFVPRVPDHRPGVEPYVWVVDEQRAWTYYFPRDCPRILLWPTADTTTDDLQGWFGGRPNARIACIEEGWVGRMHTTPLYRYEMDAARFRPLADDSWMLVSRDIEQPLAVVPMGDLVEALTSDGVDLRLMPDLSPLFGAWEHSFHVSGIRLRNAVNWPEGDPPPAPLVA